MPRIGCPGRDGRIDFTAIKPARVSPGGGESGLPGRAICPEVKSYVKLVQETGTVRGRYCACFPLKEKELARSEEENPHIFLETGAYWEKNSRSDGKRGRRMEDHTIKLLEECSQGCKMGIQSMDQVEEYVSDAKLRKAIDRCREEHRKLETEADRMLTQHGKEGRAPEKMASAMSWLSTEMKMMMKDDDRQAAKIMTDGCSMGIKTLSSYLNQYTGASASSRELAEKLVKSEEKFRDDMKAFL